jgi:sugar phosphate permease
MQMKGLAGLNGWRWIFIIEGVITCVLGIAGYWLIVDLPDKALRSFNFITERERDWIVDRVHRDRGDAHVPKFNLRLWLGGGADWKVWAYAMMFFNTTTVTYALAYFLPIILREQMGFDVGQSQCLVAPPYALAGIVMYSTAWVGDRYKIRGPIVIGNVILMLIGLPIMGFHKKSAVRYFGVFLVTAGANSNVPAVMAYQANNIRGQWKRAFCSALLVGFGGIGGIAGTLVFRDQDKKTGYKPGMYAAIACSLLTIILVCVLTVDHYFQNKKADRGEKVLEPHAVSDSHLADRDSITKSSQEDAGINFRYTY